MNKKIIFGLVLTFILNTLATAATLDVNQTTGPYYTIQDAIDDASNDDIISVANGTYTGALNRDLDFGGLRLTVKSASDDPSKCIINCQGVARGFYFGTGEDQTSVVRGFTITNGNATYGGGIECEGTSPTIENCIIKDCTADFGGAIDCLNASPFIQNCIITNNSSNYDGSAIECGSESTPEIRNCLITDNTAGGYGAIDCYDLSSVEILNCTITNNIGADSVGGVYSTGSTVTIINSILWNNDNDLLGTGITSSHSCIQDSDTGTGNIHTDPMFRTGPLGDFYLSQTDANQLATSDCVNGGDRLANAIFNDLGFPTTTRTDNVEDAGTVDIGFHYPSVAGLPAYYNLTTYVDPNSTTGTIDPNYPTPGHNYKQFTEVLLTATPKPNYRFQEWNNTDDDNSTSLTNVVTMNAAKTVTAKFSLTATYKLTSYVLGGNGSIINVVPHNLPDHNDSRAYYIPQDTNATITVQPNTGYVVKQWFKGDTATFDINDALTYEIIAPSGNSLTTAINADTTIVVEFKYQKYLLTTITDGNGTLLPKRGYYPAGTTVQLVATPKSGYRVHAWGKNAANKPAWNTPTNTVDMNAPRDVNVSFELGTNRVIHVPGDASTIAAAITMANNGDTILLAPDTYSGQYFIINKVISIVGDPEQPENVVIDYSYSLPVSGISGFELNGEAGNPNPVVLNGVTIKNLHTAAGRGCGGIPGANGNNGVDHYYGAIRVNGSHKVLNCIVQDCTLIVGAACNGVAGGDPNFSFNPDGGNGGNGGNAGGAGIAIISGDPNIRNVLIENCRVYGGNGGNGAQGFYQNETNPNDPNTPQFPPGFAGNGGMGGSALGGGICIIGGTYPTFTDVTVRNCKAVAGSGGNGANALSGVEANDVHASEIPGADPNALNGGNGNFPGEALGGGIFCDAGISPTFINCSIENCTIYGGKGGNGGNGTSVNGAFSYIGIGGSGGLSTSVTANGGAVFCDSASNPTFRSCSFMDNKAYGSISGLGGRRVGGAYTQPWENIRVPANGAGVACRSTSTSIFEKCRFENNRTAFSEDYSDTNYTDVIEFDDVNALTEYNGEYTGNGGGLCVLYPSFVDINDCNFIANRAPLGAGIYGVGVTSEIHIDNSNILNNNSYSGGGVLLLDSIGSITKSIIQGNTAGPLPDIDNTTSYAVNGTGGGIYSLSSLLDIKDTSVTENSAEDIGGGICIDGYWPYMPYTSVIKNCLITDNSAVNAGGGIAAIYFAEPTILDCTISQNHTTDVNSMGSGLFASYLADVIVKDSILWQNGLGNTGINGSQIALSSGSSDMPASLNISYSDIQTFSQDDDANLAMDIVILIDTTGSMGNVLNSIKAAAGDIVDSIAQKTSDYRIAVVDYRDFPALPYGTPGIDYTFNDDLGFTSNRTAVQNAINDISLGSGADRPESVYSAVIHSADGSSLGYWRSGSNVKKLILLMGDAPGHDPCEPYGSNYTLNDAIGAANNNNINIYSILTGSGVGDDTATVNFTSLAESTGGILIESPDGSTASAAVVQAIDIATLPSTYIYLDDPRCSIVGIAQDINDVWFVEGSSNISEDPNFISGYYLSHIATGQPKDSNCIDAGSATALAVGLNTYTTRLDGISDSGIVDMGYHYYQALPLYMITIQILPDANYPGIHGKIIADPNNLVSYDSSTATYTYRFYKGTVPSFTAVPDSNYFLKGWYDETDVKISTQPTLTFMVEANDTYFVRFRHGRIISVSGGGSALRDTVNNADSGDTLIVAAGTYSGDIDIAGKQIKLYGVNPDDPNIVARTIIDCSGGLRGFTFTGGENHNTVIDGFTIINGGGDITDIVRGGAIFIDTNSSPLIVNIDISNCNVRNTNGGAIYISTLSNPEFRNVNIANCSTTTGSGGGVYISNNSNPIFKDCSIANCNAAINGGAVYCSIESSPTFTNCSFSGNNASDSAGAIFYSALCTAKPTGCDFSNNTAGNEGGAVMCSTACIVEINDCNFSDNSADYAGAIYISADCNGSIFDTTMTSNSATEDGGAMYIIDSNVIDINNCKITQNTSLRGGGIFALTSPDVTITDCIISSNQAYINAGSVSQGGGIYAFASIERIVNSRITNNTANTSGGGIYIAGEQADTNHPLIKNCLIANNSADRDGGGISANWYTTVRIQNCTIANNDGALRGGGISGSYGSITDVNNSIVWGNSAIDGNQIALASGDEAWPLPSNLTIAHCDVNTVGIYTDAGCNVTENDNITVNPIFVLGYYLSSTDAGQDYDSPCFDMGFGTSAQSGLDTFTTRVDGFNDAGTVDLGYHYSRGPAKRTVTLTVLEDSNDPPVYTQIIAEPASYYVSYDPNTLTYTYNPYEGMSFKLTGVADANHYVRGWYDQQDSLLASTQAYTFTVSSDSNNAYFVRFKPRRTIHIPGAYPYTNIQQAIDDAQNGDIIIIHSGNYIGTGFMVEDKEITISSANPDDPCAVASTIIDCTNNVGGGFILYNTGSGSCTLNGLTIVNARSNVVDSEDGENAGDPGGDGGWFYGMGVRVIGNHRIVNCIIRDCSNRGGNAGNGENGDSEPNTLNGGRGGEGGDAFGAGILVYSGSPFIKNCLVENCTSTGGNGGNGGNGNDDSDGILSGVGGRGGYAGRAFGAGIACLNNSNPTFENCTVRNCQVIGGLAGNGGDTGEGAGAGAYGGLADADPGQDEPTNHSAYGGGIYVGKNCSATFTGCTVTNNTTNGSISGLGGMSYNDVQQLPHENFNIASYGAGIFCDANSYTSFTSCDINDNNTTLHSNYYVGNGGGIAFVNASSSQLSNCEISGNSSNVGGGFYSTTLQSLTVNNCRFYDNIAYIGGGMFTIYGKADINYSYFTQNTASWYTEPNDPNATIDSFIYGAGGGIYSYSTEAHIRNCQIAENTSTGSGGGIYLGGELAKVDYPRIANCLIINNKANRDGGGISANWFATPTITNCTIANNIVTPSGLSIANGGGIYCSYASQTDVNNSIIWGNIANEGSQIALSNDDAYSLPATAKVTYCDIQDPNQAAATALDVVILVDTTGSMSAVLDSIKAAAANIVNRIALNTPDYRIAVVDFRDFPISPYGAPGMDYAFKDDSRFTSSSSIIQTAINNISLGYGGDWEESVYSALMHCINGSSLGNWRSDINTKKIIILMGDAPPHDPEPTTGYTLEMVTEAAKTSNINIYSILTGSGSGNATATYYFKGLAEGTSGVLISTPDGSTASESVIHAIDLATLQAKPVFVESGSTLTYWTSAGGWDDVNSYNIHKDPNFVFGYYLSHIDAGQDFTSPCFDWGLGEVNSLGLNYLTTRTDNFKDINPVDLGYHYSTGIVRYELLIDVNTADANGTIAHPWEPNSTPHLVYKDQIVRLCAVPDVNTRVAQWIIDGNSIDNHSRYYNLTMNRNHTVTVVFEPYAPKNLVVPDQYATIQEAINAAESGDTIYIYKKSSGLPHYITDPNGLDFQGKTLTIRSENPNDPNIVATTIIDCNNRGRAFIFQNGEDANSIIEGLTITNGLAAGEIATGTTIVYDPCDANIYYASGVGALGDGFGGAIYCDANTSPTIRKCVFTNCQATGGQGADGRRGYDLLENDDRDQGGRGGNGGYGSGNGFGGVIFCDKNSSPTILDCSFSANTARGGVGGDGGIGGNGTSSNPGGSGGNGGNGSGYGYGGVIYCTEGSLPKISDCTFSENTATMGLGGAGAPKGLGQIPQDNQPVDGSDGSAGGAGFGGVIYYEQGATADINNCKFLNNTANANTTDTSGSSGGAIYCEPNCAAIKIVKSNLAGNEATRGSGGAIGLGANNNITLENCYFGGNLAGENGGALGISSKVDANTCNFNFTNCAFTNNTAANWGGGIYAKNTNADINDCFINRNTANSGGGLFFVTKSTLKVHGGTLMNNKAIGEEAEGGGAMILHLPAEFINCQIIGNTSQYSGAGLMFKGQETSDSQVHNCLFVDNSAVARGGAIVATLHSSPTITSCTFSANQTESGGAGGGIFCTYNSSPIIRDCIFDRTNRIAIYEDSIDSDPNISYCFFNANFDGDFSDLDSRLYDTYNASDPNAELAALNAHTGDLIAGTSDDNLRRTVDKTDLIRDSIFKSGPLGNYYLKQKATDPNDENILAIDHGSADATDIEVTSGKTMADYTTRIDNAGDQNQLDIGFHYMDANDAQQFYLETKVLGGHGSIEPLSRLFYAGSTVTITASPDTGWRVNEWNGTDDDSTTKTINYVAMISDRSVTVSFEQPKNLYVPGEYTAIQYAINDAKDGDKIILSRGTYQFNDTNYDYPAIQIWGKNITITSTNPDDPCIVAATVFLSSRFSIQDVDQNMVLDGITIQDAHYAGGNPDCPDNAISPDGINGYSIIGGAMIITNASPTIRNCRFIDCSASGGDGTNNCSSNGDGGWAGYAWGGAVGIDSASNPIFKNCQFINCYVRGGNGGDGDQDSGHGGNWGDPNGNVLHTWDNADGRGVNGGYADYWFYSGYGGAIYCSAGSEPQFEKCLFSGNRSYGGVCGTSDPRRWPWPNEHYVIDSFGGAVYLAAGSEVKFTDCNFVDNQADTRNQIGDANTTYDITDWVLSNPVVSYGGAICAEGTATPVVKNCKFVNNIACAGGGMYWEDSIAHISKSTITECRAMLGGGVLFIDSNSLVSDCNFTSNMAVNQAGQGGAIYCASGSAKFYDCQIIGNSAAVSGGGAYFTGELEPNMHNCLIVRNSANRDGGGISANWDVQLRLSNCTIANNEATGGNFTASFGGGLSCAYEAYANIINSILWNNNVGYGGHGPQISIGSSFDAADKRKAEVTVQYSDVQGGAADVFSDQESGCKLNGYDVNTTNLAGTSLTSPSFVTKLVWGDYFLSENATGDPNQPVDSNCIDAGFGTALDNHMYRHTTRTDLVPDDADSNVDMGYHYTLTAEILGDFNFDGKVDIIDFTLFIEYWMDSDCTFPYFCNGRDFTEDGEVDYEDYALFAENYGNTEKIPPVPNPMTWAVRPRSSGLTQITMTATTAKDNSGSTVQYEFVCISGSGHNRTWSTDPNYTDTGLTAGTQYGYRVRAKDAHENETGWSTIGYAIPGEDSTPPTPNPMTWLVVPEANSSSVHMTATTAIDVCGVEYYFDETSGNTGATDSGWISSSIYEDTDLEPNTTYAYRVKARDKSTNHNETGYSTEISVTTLSQGQEPNDVNVTDILPPTPNPSQWATAPYVITDGLYYYHTMTAVAAADVSPPVEYEFVCVTGSGNNSGWITTAAYTTGAMWAPNHSAYKVRTKDALGNIGQWSTIWHTYYGEQ